MTPRARLYFWRTRAGDEVDFVVEHGRRVLAIEVKMTDAPGYRHTAGLRRFLEEHPTAAGGILLHAGAAVQRLDEKIVALPWTMLTTAYPSGASPVASSWRNETVAGADGSSNTIHARIDRERRA